MYKKLRALLASWSKRTPQRVRISLQDGTVLDFALVKNIARDFYVLKRSPSTEELIEKERWRVRMRSYGDKAFTMFFPASEYATLLRGDSLYVEVGMAEIGWHESAGKIVLNNGVQSNKIASVKKV